MVSAGPARAATISVVDDDASLRRSVANFLRSLGFDVKAFESSEAFLRSDAFEVTACMVLDVSLPGLSGLELLEHLREARSTIGVILLTAHDDAGVRRRALELGARAFLLKPLRPAELVSAVNACLRPEG